MVGAYCLGRLPLDVVSSAPGKIQQCKIDDAIAHVDRRAYVEVLASDLLEVENFRIELCGSLQVSDANSKVAQPCHRNSPRGSVMPAQRSQACADCVNFSAPAGIHVLWPQPSRGWPGQRGPRCASAA